MCQLFNRSFLTKIFLFSRAHCFYCFFAQEQSTQDSLTHRISQNVKNGAKISTQMSILYKELPLSSSFICFRKWTLQMEKTPNIVGQLRKWNGLHHLFSTANNVTLKDRVSNLQPFSYWRTPSTYWATAAPKLRWVWWKGFILWSIMFQLQLTKG